MAAPTSSTSTFRPLIILGSIVLVTASLYLAQKILIPLAVAVLLAFILSPVVDALQRHGLWRVPSAILVVALSILLVSGIGLSLALQLKNLAAGLPKYKDNIALKIAELREAGQGTVLSGLYDMIRELTEEDSSETRAREGIPREVVLAREQASGMATLEKFAGPVGELLASVGLVVVLVGFMLIRREDLRNRLVRLVAHGRLIITTRAFEEGARRLSRFLLMQLIINASFGIVLGIGLALIRVPYSLLWGILAAALRFVPYLGSLITTVLVVLFSVAVLPTWTQPILVLALLLVLELTTANAVEPLAFGHSTGVSPVALLTAAAFWTWLWGPIGLVLSTPLTACLVVLGRFVPHLEFLGVLLGDEPALGPEVVYYQRLLARDQDEATNLVEQLLQRQSKATVCDTVLAPALVLAKRDRERGGLIPDDELFVVQATRDIVDDLISFPPQVALNANGTPPTAPTAPARVQVRVLGCPARDQEDELALHMLRHLLASSGYQIEVVSASTFTGEIIARIQNEKAAVVCIGALAPGGLAQTRLLCKRLREQFPDLIIIVGRWGLTEHSERVHERLLLAGANQVAATELEAHNKLVPLLQSLSHVKPTSTSA